MSLIKFALIYSDSTILPLSEVADIHRSLYAIVDMGWLYDNTHKPLSELVGIIDRDQYIPYSLSAVQLRQEAEDNAIENEQALLDMIEEPIYWEDE
jgi:hypothetical protein